MDGAGIVGTDGTTGAGEATVAGVGTTGVGAEASAMLGVHLTAMAMLIKGFMEIEVMPTIQEDVVITMVVEH